jgi:serine/threonine-protein kinase HipA
MDGKWELAPAYDICYAYSPDHRWVSQHALSINGKRKDIMKSDLLALASSSMSRRRNPSFMK